MGFDYAKYKAAVTGSPLNKNGFGPKEQEKTTTGDSGSLREVIEDVRTKGADLIGKIHKGFDKPLVKNLKGMGNTIDSMTNPPNTVQNVARLGSGMVRLQYGLTPTVFGKLGGQLLENIIRPGKQGGFFSDQYGDQVSGSLEKAREELKSGTKAKKPMKAKSPVKAKKPMKAKSPTKFNAKLKAASAAGQLSGKFKKLVDNS